MILRSILLLGVGAAFACATPAFSAGTVVPAKTETAAAAQPQAVAALETETPKADVPAAKKPSPNRPRRRSPRRKPRRKTWQSPRKPSLKSRAACLPALFGGDIKDEKSKAKQKTAKATPARADPQGQGEEAGASPSRNRSSLSIIGNNGELRSEKQAKPTLFAGLFGGRVAPTAARDPRARLRSREEAGQEEVQGEA